MQQIPFKPYLFKKQSLIGKIKPPKGIAHNQHRFKAGMQLWVWGVFEKEALRTSSQALYFYCCFCVAFRAGGGTEP